MHPPASAKPFSKLVLDAALSRGARQVQRKVAGEALPNGHWDDEGRVHIWVPAGLRIDRATIANLVAAALSALIGRGHLPILDEGRWKGAGEALGRILLGVSVNNLLKRAFALFCERMRSTAPKPVPKRVSRAAPPLDVPSRIAILDAMAAGEPAPAVPIVPLVAAQANPAAQAAEWEKQREETDTSRAIAKEWLNTNPRGCIYLTKRVFDVYEDANDHYVWTTGQRFESLQQGIVAKGVASGLSEADAQALRTYPVLEAAKGTVERKFEDRCTSLLLDHTQWDPIMLGNDRSFSSRSLCFRTISMADCGVHDSINHVNKMLPIRMFLALVSADAARELEQLPRCRRTALFQKICEIAGADGLRGRVGKAVLVKLAEEACVETWNIEGLHALIRRHLKVKSVQTVMQSLVECNCEYIIGKARANGILVEPVEDGSESSSDESEAERRRTNPWNVFVRKMTIGKRRWLCTSDISAAYKALDEAAKQRLLEECRAADAVDEASGGLNSRRLGPKTQDLRKFEAENLKKAKRQQLIDAKLVSSDMSRNDVVDNAVSHALSNSSSMGDIQAMAKDTGAHLALHNELRKEFEADLEGALATYKERVAGTSRDAFAKALDVEGGRTLSVGQFSPMPSDGLALDVRFNCSLAANASSALATSLVRQGSNFGQALELDLLAKCRPIMHSECPPCVTETVSKPSISAKPPECTDDDMCFCCEDGRLTHRLRCRFLDCQKAQLKGEERKDMLLDRRIFAELHGVREAPSGAFAIELASERGLPTTSMDARIMWHIGHHSFSPYRSTYRVMVRNPSVKGLAANQLGLTAPPRVINFRIEIHKHIAKHNTMTQ